MDKIIALVSGLDSFCYLGQYIDKYEIEVLIFNYGQRAQHGISVTTSLLDSLRPEHPHLACRTLDIQSLKFAYPGFQQTTDHLYPQGNYNPSTVVLPLRNTIFLTIAMAYAQKVGAMRIIIGSTIDDTSWAGIDGFPDLNPKYLLNLEHLLGGGCFPSGNLPVEIWSPARQGMSKGKNLRNGFEAFGEMVYEAYSCYSSSERHCGQCYGLSLIHI